MNRLLFRNKMLKNNLYYYFDDNKKIFLKDEIYLTQNQTIYNKDNKIIILNQGYYNQKLDSNDLVLLSETKLNIDSKVIIFDHLYLYYKKNPKIVFEYLSEFINEIKLYTPHDEFWNDIFSFVLNQEIKYDKFYKTQIYLNDELSNELVLEYKKNIIIKNQKENKLPNNKKLIQLLTLDIKKENLIKDYYMLLNYYNLEDSNYLKYLILSNIYLYDKNNFNNILIKLKDNDLFKETINDYFSSK